MKPVKEIDKSMFPCTWVLYSFLYRVNNLTIHVNYEAGVTCRRMKLNTLIFLKIMSSSFTGLY